MGSAKSVTTLYFHGFWGQPSDIAQGLFPLESVDYTRIKLLNSENFLLDWPEQFFSWLDQRGIHSPVRAIGYSQGGRLLMGAFALRPERFHQLLLISSHPGLTSLREREARLKSDRLWAQKFRKSSWDELESEWNSQLVFQGGVERPRQESEFEREDLALCFENWSLAHQPDFREDLQKNKEKIQVILGERDQKYRDLYSELQLRVQIAKGAAHRVPSDQPSVLAEILKNNLS